MAERSKQKRKADDGLALTEDDHARADTGERRQCRGITRKGTRCPWNARPGTTTCKKHTRATARPDNEARELIEMIQPGLFNTDATPITDPVAELARIGGIYRHAVEWIGERVNALEERIRYISPGQGTEQIRAEVQLWERLLDRYQKHLVDMAKLDIDQRMAAMREMYAAAVVAGIRGMLVELRLTPEQQKSIPEAARKHLTLTTGMAGVAVIAGEVEAEKVVDYRVR